MNVIELVDENGKWNRQKMQNWMPQAMLHKIQSLLLPKADYASDEFIVVGIGGGVFFGKRNVYNNVQS